MAEAAFTLWAALLLLITVTSSNAWWCTGHSLVAEIARQKLDPKVEHCANELIDHLSGDYPRSSTFTTASCWADDLKENDVNMYNTWHYINYAYVKEPLNSAVPTVSDINVVWALSQTNETLHSHSSIGEKATALRFLIHFVGDIHQPLHDAVQYSVKLPDGDLGGNLFPIEGETVDNLHAFWDSGATQWRDYHRPMRPLDAKYLESLVNQITNDHPENSLRRELEVSRFEDWAGESYKIAASASYNTSMGGLLSESYKKSAREICDTRVALGGYRLARLVNSFCNVTKV